MYNQAITGQIYTKTFKAYVQLDGVTISPFHDIPLYPGKGEDTVNIVNEIPRFENAKFEINKEEKMNPIMQDTKKGIVRFVPNIFPSKGYPWNYGAIPQTWEDPEIRDGLVNELGDNDPVDVIEIGKKRKKIGEVYQAKILGCLALIDKGECDWKVLVIDMEDGNASVLNSIEDVEKVYSGLLDLTFKWFRDYKIPSGSPENVFGFGGEFKGRDIAMEIVKNAHMSWKRLMKGPAGNGISKCNSQVSESPYRIEKDFEVEGNKQVVSTELPECVYEYYFVPQGQ